jgi:hypothetical protein
MNGQYTNAQLVNTGSNNSQQQLKKGIIISPDGELKSVKPFINI